MLGPDPRDRAWDDIHDLLPARWHFGPPTYEPGLHTWTVVVRAPNTGRRNLRPPKLIAGTRRGWAGRPDGPRPAAARAGQDRPRGRPRAPGPTRVLPGRRTQSQGRCGDARRWPTGGSPWRTRRAGSPRPRRRSRSRCTCAGRSPTGATRSAGRSDGRPWRLVRSAATRAQSGDRSRRIARQSAPCGRPPLGPAGMLCRTLRDDPPAQERGTT